MAPVIGYVTGINGLLVNGDLSNQGESLTDRHVLLQADKLGCHDASGRVFGVFQEFVDRLAVLGGRVCENTLHHIGGHLLDQVYRIIHVQLVQNFPELLITEGFNQNLLEIGIEFDKHVCCQFLRQNPVQNRKLVLRNLLEHFRDIGGRHIHQNLSEVRVLLFVQQLHGIFQGKSFCIHAFTS